MSHWLFAPWKWKSRWLLCAMIVLLPAMYFFSAEPLTYLSNQLELPVQVDAAIIKAYKPVWWCRDNSQIARQVIAWEGKLLTDTFGDWRLRYIPVR